MIPNVDVDLGETEGVLVDAKMAEAQCEVSLQTAKRHVEAAEMALKAARTDVSAAWEAHNRSIAERVRRALEAKAL